MKWFSYLAVVTAALALSPSGGYAPANVECPDTDILRDANGLSPEEDAWVTSRNPNTKQRITEFLKDSNLTDFDVDSFMNQVEDTIKIGIAFSGGGYRAMFNGAGQLLALDDRFEDSNTKGLGGLLQSSTYITGLSGGSWLVGSVVLNNYTSIIDILEANEIWQLEDSILNYGGWDLIKAAKYWSQICDAIHDKEDAGFEATITDLWGRALSYQFFTTMSKGGVELLWSDIRDIPDFKNHNLPFPIVVADGREPGTYDITANSTIVEFTPFEMGSWDPSVYKFSDIRYIGTDMVDGKPVDGKCYAGFENAGFILGTSSSIFNEAIISLEAEDLPGIVEDPLVEVLKLVSKSEEDIALYEPNPFYNTTAGNVPTILEDDTLFLCDGGFDDQNIPLQPLIQREREVDVIFAYDNSADTDQNWPNGTAMVATYERQFIPAGNGTKFPYVPDATSFRNLNLTSKPTFFGCDAKNLTSLFAEGEEFYYPPLIVYTANRPFDTWSNTSTFQLSYENSQRDAIITNAFESATRLNGTLDEDFRSCVSCAIIRRTQERLNIEQSQQCKDCFDKYCWNGDIDNVSVPGTNFTLTGINYET